MENTAFTLSLAVIASHLRPLADGNALRTMLPWLPTAFVAVHLKNAMLSCGGYRIVARVLGRAGGDQITPWESLSLFRADLVFNFVLAPVAFVLALEPLPPAARPAVVAALSAVTSLLLYAQLQSTYKVGRFLSKKLLADALKFFRHNAEAASYVNRRGLARLGVTLGAIAGVTAWCVATSRPPARPEALQPARLALPALFVLSSSLAWLPRVPRTRYHENVVVRAFHALLGEDTADRSAVAGLEPRAVVDLYHRLAVAPTPPIRDPRYFGKAEGYDVLFFVLETAPAKCADLLADLGDMPVLRSLRDASFVAPLHHTTYPYTNRAVYSLLSGCYPNNDMLSLVEMNPDFRAPGIFRTLGARGYETAVYNPQANSFEEDDRLFEGLATKHQKFPPPASLPPEATDPARRPWERRKARDEVVLAMLKADLEGWIDADQRYAAAFLPQIGHSPWNDFTEVPDDPVLRGRAFIAMQDRWLGEIVELLRRKGRLDRTLIVFTGDHGLRTREEDPSFEGNTIDRCSFHVPLLIHAPKILSKLERNSWLTSHVDVVPTLLDLLGVEEGRGLEQGSPIWDARLADRTTFLFANHFLGADGYHSAGRFYMWSHVTDSVYANGEALHFETRDHVPLDAPLRAEVVGMLRRIVAVQQVWGKLSETYEAGEPAARSRGGG